MRHEHLLDSKKALLMVIDIQDAFTPYIYEMDRVVERTRIMIEAAKLLELPVLVTEQYPRALGSTVETLRATLGDICYFDKLTFSCCQDETIRSALIDSGRSQVILTGIESHICVQQTACDLIKMGMTPFLAADAVSSRRPFDADISRQRMQQTGVFVTTTEAALMEMLISSKHPAFKAISKLIK